MKIIWSVRFDEKSTIIFIEKQYFLNEKKKCFHKKILHRKILKIYIRNSAHI